MVLNSKDLLKYILSFISFSSLRIYENDITDPVEIASIFITVIAVSFHPTGIISTSTWGNKKYVFPPRIIKQKKINKLFNICIHETVSIIVSVNSNISISSQISSHSKYTNLKQLYLIDRQHQFDNETLDFDCIHSNICFPSLLILQIDYLGDVNMLSLCNKNVPKLNCLILGCMFNEPELHNMRINKLDLDLLISELRIHQCSISDFESLRVSLAKCCYIDTLFLMFKSFNNRQENKFHQFHSLCLPNVQIMFLQNEYLPQLTIYAPQLNIIQFYFCDKLDALILLDNPPIKSKKYLPNNWEQHFEEYNKEKYYIVKNPNSIQVEFDNTQDLIFERHMSHFKVFNRHGEITDTSLVSKRFTWACNDMSVWPFAYYD